MEKGVVGRELAPTACDEHRALAKEKKKGPCDSCNSCKFCAPPPGCEGSHVGFSKRKRNEVPAAGILFCVLLCVIFLYYTFIRTNLLAACLYVCSFPKVGTFT